MNPKKLYIACFIITLLIFSLSLFNVISYYSKDNQILESTTYTDNSNLISVYIENEEGNYVLSETTNFDQGTGYVYNEEKSYCVNESVLSYNEETSKISVTASGTDNCYVYFDAIPTLLSVVYDSSKGDGLGIFSSFELNGDYDIAYYEINGKLYDTSSSLVFSCGIDYEIRVLLTSGIYSNYLTVNAVCLSYNYFSISDATDADGNEVILTISTATEIISASDAVEALGLDVELTNIAIITQDITAPEDTVFPVTITLSVAGVTEEHNTYILHYTDDSEWEIVEATSGDGAVTFTVDSLSPIALVIE